LEAERGRAAADDPLALLALAPGQDELAIGPFDGLLEQLTLEDLPTRLDGGFQVFGQVRVLIGHGQFEGHLSLEREVVALDLDLVQGDLSLMSVRSTHGDVLLCRGELPCVLFYSTLRKFSRFAHRLATARKIFADFCGSIRIPSFLRRTWARHGPGPRWDFSVKGGQLCVTPPLRAPSAGAIDGLAPPVLRTRSGHPPALFRRRRRRGVRSWPPGVASDQVTLAPRFQYPMIPRDQVGMSLATPGNVQFQAVDDLLGSRRLGGQEPRSQGIKCRSQPRDQGAAAAWIVMVPHPRWDPGPKLDRDPHQPGNQAPRGIIAAQGPRRDGTANPWGPSTSRDPRDPGSQLPWSREHLGIKHAEAP